MRLLNSKTNPAVDSADIQDLDAPFTFMDFIKSTVGITNPHGYNDAYNEYLHEWYSSTTASRTEVQNQIKIRYIELLKDIALNYTTPDEQRFLSNIDYNDPLDLDIVIPFYSAKIVEICTFFQKQREKLKLKVEEFKGLGTNPSVTHAIKDIISTYVQSNDIPLSGIDINTSIEIEPFYDLYSNYFDIDPRIESDRKYFSANVNDIKVDAFVNFDRALKNAIFQELPIYISELGSDFTITLNLDDISLDCDPDTDLYTLINGTSADQGIYVQLEKDLMKKYAGTDFYFLSTGSSLQEIVSGKLFDADSASSNLLNRLYPSTATIREDSELYSIREIGAFFVPKKTGILYFGAPSLGFYIDKDTLRPNSIYAFPDPYRYGTTAGLTDKIQPQYVKHAIDDSPLIKNASDFYAEGDPRISPYSQEFYGYYSSNISQNYLMGKDGLKSNFAALYNQGTITQYQSDMWGNTYALLKSSNRKTTELSPGDSTLSPIVTGSTGEYGSIYIKNAVSSEIQELPGEIYSKYPLYIKNEVRSGVKNFQIQYDTIYIETETSYIIDKIVFDAGEFKQSSTVNTIIDLRNGPLAEAFFYEDNASSLLAVISSVSPNVYFPVIYRYENKMNRQIFPRGEDINSLFAIPDISADIKQITTARLFYSTRNEKHGLVYIGTDVNDIPYTFVMTFSPSKNGINIISLDVIAPQNNNGIHTLSSDTFSEFLSGSNVGSTISIEGTTINFNG